MPVRFLASASVPFVFPNQHIDGRILMDGGTIWNVNLEAAIQRCREIVDRDEDIILDVAICSDGKLESINATGNTIENYLRTWNLASYQNSLNDVREQRRGNPKIQYRYFFMASKPLAHGLDELTFTPEIIWPMIDIGKEDAYTMVTTTKPGDSFKKLDEWFENQSNLRVKYPNFADYLYEKQPEEAPK